MIIERRKGDVRDIVAVGFLETLLLLLGIAAAAMVAWRGDDVISGSDVGIEEGAGGNKTRTAAGTASGVYTSLNFSVMEHFWTRVFVAI